MNTSMNKKFKVAKGYEKLFNHTNEEEKFKHRARIIMMMILQEAEKNMGNLSKKEMAEKLDTSASYITQLYKGDKILNLELMAKIEEAFGIEFTISASPVKRKRTKSKSVTY
jgi:ribosome-binding protein aMBF1 (putative translation factor)